VRLGIGTPTAPPTVCNSPVRIHFPHVAPVPAQAQTFDLPLGDHALRVRTIAAADRDAEHRPTLVFLHDSLGCITLWREFPERLVAALRCNALVYDRRGYGASSPFGPEPRTPRYLEDEADVVGRVLEACGVSEAVLFGHSDGGSIALVAAARRPEVVQAVVTEGAHVFVEERTLAGIRDAREALRTTDLRERLWRHHGERTDAVTSAWIDVWLSPGFRDWNIEPHLRSIRCPILILQGTEDEYGTPEQVRAIAERVSGPARAHLIPGVGHTPHRAAPNEVLRLTTAFLAEAVPALSRLDPSPPRAPASDASATQIRDGDLREEVP
jgi:pimeloyl-ACP methyl ester carboxylesterase